MTLRFIVFILALLLHQAAFAQPLEGERLVWSDEFDYTGTPDQKKWFFQTGDGCPNLCGWGNQEKQMYTDILENARVEDGKLIIEALKKGDRWTSARITTKTKKSFTFGRIEFRAKLPSGVGTWPALWMLGENIDTKGWPVSGEIDIMEHVGRNKGIVQAAIHTNAMHGNTINKDTVIVKNIDRKFHVYTLNWKKDCLEFYVDGEKFYSYRPEKFDVNYWPFDQPQYILMNLAIGGTLGGSLIDPKMTSAKMEIDYVRVYQ